MSAEQFPRAADDRTLTANCALTHRIWNLEFGICPSVLSPSGLRPPESNDSGSKENLEVLFYS